MTLRDELLAMIGEDDSVSARLAADGSLFDGYHPEMEEVHNRNADRLAQLLEGGWPAVAQVGADGADAAFRIAQHAISRPDFQRRCRELLQAAVAAGEADPKQLAMLTDRIRCLEGRVQLYGTQFEWDDDGHLSPSPISDPEDVDLRRASVGLGPLAEAIAHQRQRAVTNGERPPGDPAEHRAEYEKWRRRVGW
ncbi:hypothetical protein H7K24_19425 [Mycobacterium fragae]|uniref:DUF6624 domain-containing protein n=1 Tax=Mycobacterium fragae TaxID=1260918 RepID=UPI000A14CCF5|nr:DUF6624 domain-containing protein [Mycobacterium fragae]MCV7402312.1 hypothetical protein [Mycobacterium fragae]